MNENAYLLITKLIEQTKSLSLHWCGYATSPILLKPVKREIFSDSTFFPEQQPIINEASFLCQHGNAVFLLIAAEDLWGNPFLTLYVQTTDSSYSKVYASTEDNDIQISSELKRLYNLIDSMDDPVDDSVRNFIDL